MAARWRSMEVIRQHGQTWGRTCTDNAGRKKVSELFRVLNIIRFEVNTRLTTIDLHPTKTLEEEDMKTACVGIQQSHKR